MLAAEEIRKSYRRKQVLAGVSFQAKEGECVGIVGANGCGKTTLLSILAGALKADGGSFVIDGEEALGKEKLFSRKVAYVPQENPLIPELTVPQEEYRIGKYGMLRRTYLKAHRRSLYSIMLMNGTLLRHLEEIDKAATEQVQRIVEQTAKAENITEELKAQDPLKWTGLMNNLLHSAEETVLGELVYS